MSRSRPPEHAGVPRPGRALRRLAVAAALAAAGAAAVPGAAAETYPARPVRMIVPFAPGGAGDYVARILQAKLTEVLGQQVIVDNRPGAAGNIGVEVAGRSTADGYTLLLGNVGAMAINPALYARPPLDVFRTFDAVSQVVDVPGALVVNPGLPVRDLAGFIGHLKAAPGKINFGSSGGGSANRLEMEMFMMRTGTKMVHVPYRGGAGQVITGLVSNEVQASFVTFPSAVQHVRAGRLRILAAVAAERVGALPDVPTMREQGHAEFSTGSWQGIYLRAGVPADVSRAVFDAVVRSVKDPETVARLDKGGVVPVTSATPKAFDTFWRAENQRFAKVIKDAGISVE